MKIFLNTLVAAIALQHIWFLVLEMFLWQKPVGLRTFRNTVQKAETTAVLAANQGLYNGFLAAGLIVSLLFSDSNLSWHFQVFFLACITVAGFYGGYSSSRKILFLQGLPALASLLLIIFFS